MQLFGLHGSPTGFEEWNADSHYGASYFRAFVNSVQLAYLHWPFFEMLRYANTQGLQDILEEKDSSKKDTYESTASTATMLQVLLAVTT